MSVRNIIGKEEVIEITNIAPGKEITVSGTSDGNKDNVNEYNFTLKDVDENKNVYIVAIMSKILFILRDLLVGEKQD